MSIYGRDEELALLRSMLEQARAGRAGAVAIVGDPGMGKSTLLDEVASSADGTVLRVEGFEAESPLPYGGLLQLLRPVLDQLDEVPAHQRRALEAVLGHRKPDPDSQFLVAAATLSLLAAAAEPGVVIALIDDLQWMDPESAAAILFSARRLTHDRVVTIMATRNGAPAPTTLDGIDRLTLTGLAIGDAQRVLPPATANDVARRLTDAVGGNPLALTHVSALLTPAQRLGAAPLPSTLPLSDQLDAIYRPVVSSLPPELRRAAQVVAAGDDANASIQLAAMSGLALRPRLLEELEAREVVVIDPGAARFVHPLVKTAVWLDATPEERRTAHAAIAAALPLSHRSRTWHLAAASIEADEQLAGDLERIAIDDEERGCFAAASAGYQRAADLSTDGSAAARRLVGAIEAAAVVGDVDRARHLLDALDRFEPEPSTRARALLALGLLERYSGTLRRAAELLSDAAEQVEGHRLVAALSELWMTLHRLGRLDHMRKVAARLEEVADPQRPQDLFAVECYSGLIAMMDEDRDAGVTLLQRALDRFADEPSLRQDPSLLVTVVFVASWVGLDPDLVALIEAAVDNARRLGALGALVPTLSMTAHGRMWLGDHAGAFADATEAVSLAEELSFVCDAAPAVELLAWQCASRGDHAGAERHLRHARSLVERAGTIGVAVHFALTAAYCALCRNDVAAVVATLEPWLDVDGGRGARGELLGIAPLLVEGYCRTGDERAAAELADRFAALPDLDPKRAALALRCQALAAGDDPASVALFEAACAAHDEAFDEPFETARTRLLFGTSLRLARHRRLARDQLNAARDAFDAMGLTLWEQRCVEELAASGETNRRSHTGRNDPLTPQETRVAELVASGMTNAEAAAALFISAKTVEHHLSSVYRKLGVRSRTELAVERFGR
ncbi:helix-turn-helix transcriptional regulator [Dermatobacter hominis]|uniref:helix-turn-helix transcriptional regulator n=1 Tax=Dermatobacter hominis TaxID=2884263 RepID=UPI001D0FF1CE|nr:LuxR family transcriptional regulator [Dermatobacter hominis]UDY36092.1 LuxR family transcriptional regulator [Dermatobacter hominis]